MSSFYYSGQDIRARERHGDTLYIVGVALCPLCDRSLFVEVPRGAVPNSIWSATCSQGGHGSYQQTFKIYARKRAKPRGSRSLEIWGVSSYLSSGKED